MSSTLYKVPDPKDAVLGWIGAAMRGGAEQKCSASVQRPQRVERTLCPARIWNGRHYHTLIRLAYQSARLSWLIWIDSFFCKIDWIDSVPTPSEFIGDWDNSLSWLRWLRSIRRWLSRSTLSNWYDWTNSVDSKNLKKVNKIDGFPKKGELNRRFSRKEGQHIYIELINLIYWIILSYFCGLIESDHMFFVTWLNRLIY